MYPGYQPKPDDVFHAVGYTTRDISDNTHFPYTGPNKEMFLSIEYLSDAAFRLCREYGIRHPAVIEKVKRADIPGNHGITLRTVHYSRI